jgi:hypothetical protein
MMRIYDLAAWAIAAAAFLGVLFILLAPTGSLVRMPLEHTRAQIEARPVQVVGVSR